MIKKNHYLIVALVILCQIASSQNCGTRQLDPNNVVFLKMIGYQDLSIEQSKAACYFSVELYAPNQYTNPEVSPLLASDFKGLPSAVIINAEFDPLRDDGILYAAKLRNAGVKVYEKMFSRTASLSYWAIARFTYNDRI